VGIPISAAAPPIYFFISKAIPDANGNFEKCEPLSQNLEDERLLRQSY